MPDDQRKIPSPTVRGNVRCMDCRCHGFNCPGMPPGHESRMMDETLDTRLGRYVQRHVTMGQIKAECDCTSPACDRLGVCIAQEVTALKARIAKLEGLKQ